MGLREQAQLDARAILEDTSGFAWPITLTSPLGVVTSLKGFTTDVGQTIDPETGQAVAGRRASAVVSLSSLPAMPEAVAERNRKPWLARFADSTGAVASWKVVEVLPDRAAGVVVLLLESFQAAIVVLTGRLALPILRLAGSLVLPLAGALALPALQLAGSISPTVRALSGVLVLPEVQLAGSATPTVRALSGALVLPEVQLAGSVAPKVAMGGALTLPEVQLAGSVSWFTLRGALVLPSLHLAGSVSPTVTALSGALVLPEVQLAGSVAPKVTMGGALTLPEVQLSGSFTTGAFVQSAWLRVANATLVSGDVSSVPDLLNGSNPAVQTSPGARPTAASSTNGLPCMRFAGSVDALSWPLASNNAGTIQWGIALWIKPDAIGADQTLYGSEIIAGASVSRCLILVKPSGAVEFDLHSDPVVDDSHGRIAQTPAGRITTGWTFVTIEYDSTAGAENLRNTITVNGVAQSLSFFNFLGAATTSTVPSATGTAALGSRNTAGGMLPFSGLYGPNGYVYGGKMAGATQGLLTTATRAAFMNFDKPT